MKEQAIQVFKSRFGKTPQIIIRSPGRVNLIGEHTDYNDGFVLPMAIDRAIWLAIQQRKDQKVILHSVDFPDPLSFSLEDVQRENGWGTYVSGIAWALQGEGYQLSGWEGVLLSDIPIGAGLSSSAALEMAAAKAFSVLGGWDFLPGKMALLGQRTENEWVGANTGVMDQMIVAAGQAGHAMLIDCRDLSTQQVPMPDYVSVVIFNSSTRHSHTNSGYNERRKQCETAARFFGVSHLRDVTLKEYNLRAEDLDDLPRRCARHVITENERVLRAVDYLSDGNVTAVCKLMNESHISMRDDFEITNEKIDVLVDLAQSETGCLGARMTGGGFGGCVVALVEYKSVESFTENVQRKYVERTGLHPKGYVCQPSNGVEIISVGQ